jgi:hypothetical protein
MQNYLTSSTILRDETIRFLIEQNSVLFDALGASELETGRLTDGVGELQNAINGIQSQIAERGVVQVQLKQDFDDLRVRKAADSV